MRSTTLPHAYREIERLKQKVQDLEAELDKERRADKPIHQLHTPPSLPPSTPEEQDPGSGDLDLGDGPSKNSWDGIHISTSHSAQKTWYGSASLFYFIGRINTFLTSALQQSHSADRLLPTSARGLFDGPIGSSGEEQGGRLIAPTDDPVNAGDYLSPTQEEYFLNLFWQSYYTSCPILDELEFKEHYQSLWANSDKERRPSALVDIVIAVCMQYGMARLPGAGRGLAVASGAPVNSNDATVAGRWHYQRCQTLLSRESESPTISTLQCHILCSIYLSAGSLQNMADNAIGLAVRTAFMLGLHLEPPATMPRREKEMRKRLWWTLYTLESKMSMKLGRPFRLNSSSTTCSLPADDREIALLSGSSFVPLGRNVTWLTWNLHNTKLLLAARAAYTAFYDKSHNVINVGNGQPITDRLEDWLKGVPEALKTRRQNNGVPFSTDLSTLEIEQFAPLWVQRQRLLLELMYHNLCTNLYRPAISFTSPTTQDPTAINTAMKCAAHAMALTHMMHQVLSSTPILKGWHEAFSWQWNAAMTLVGFVLAYPQGASTRAARSAIDLSVAIFESIGDSFAVAANAANIMSELSATVDLLTDQGQRRQSLVPIPKKVPDEMQLDMGCGEPSDESIMNGNFATSRPMDMSLNFNDTTTEIAGVLAQSMDIFATEPYNDFDWMSMGSNLPLVDGTLVA
ncbi:MAG: hypothetical protein M1822_002582 [Bathelium mastoideum]|nr:MAG: hypothetical protein M1822_002582 [Bathelium mastoideum]